MARSYWAGRRVFLTGHTGFKGSWLSLWLTELGAQVHGFALAPPTTPALFSEARVVDRLAGHTIGDVRDLELVQQAMVSARPEIIIHMAAQPLVRHSYAAPVETYAVNVMGTVNVLEAARQLGGSSALVNVTTDKCYENREWHWGYRENEPMGGLDPYSSSKGCSELVTAAYRESFQREGSPWIASARAGNVIGGGDWALDRLLPDAFRALDSSKTMTIRSPHAIRPWQHVLEPLSGYIALAERLERDGKPFAKAWNFGPDDRDAWPVGLILDHMQMRCPELKWAIEDARSVHEASFLKLDSSLARAELGWHPRWSLEQSIDQSIEWHRAWRTGTDVQSACLKQIAEYESRGGNA